MEKILNEIAVADSRTQVPTIRASRTFQASILQGIEAFEAVLKMAQAPEMQSVQAYLAEQMQILEEDVNTTKRKSKCRKSTGGKSKCKKSTKSRMLKCKKSRSSSHVN